MNQGPHKPSFPDRHWLGRLLPQIQEEDWQEAVEIYRTDKIQKFKIFESVVSCSVSSEVSASAEVRLKLHANGQLLQWAECSCRKNRKYGRYCAHIVALLLHIEENTNSNLGPRTSGKTPPIIRSLDDELLKLFADHILRADFEEGEALLNIQVEIKSGKSRHYKLDVDSQAALIQHNLNHPEKKKAWSKLDALSSLKIYPEPAFLGTYICFDINDKVEITRAVFIAKPKKTKKSTDLPFSLNVKGFLYPRSSAEALFSGKAPEAFLVFPLSESKTYLGSEYFYVPKLGYWQLDQKSSPSPSWSDAPYQRTLNDEEEEALISESKSKEATISTVLIDKKLGELVLSHISTLSQVQVFREEAGWFYIDPIYQSGDIQVSMAEILGKHLRKKKKFVKSNGRWFKIPELLYQYSWEIDEKSKQLKVSPFELIRIQAEIEDLDKFKGNPETLEKLKQRIKFSEGDAVPSLENTHLKLRKYQMEGYAWLWWLYKNDLHGLLADDMGLGKTHQTMALLSAIRDQTPLDKRPLFLIICPTTVLDHWEEKIKSFAPGLQPLKYHGAQRDGLMRKTLDHITIITSYGVLQRDSLALAAHNWQAVIFDEAHFVKNHVTATYKACRLLKAKIRICLTGTPMENKLQELKNLFDVLLPGYLGTNKNFSKNYANPIEKERDQNKEKALQRLIYPFKLRRTKEQVLDDLPEKIEDIRFCMLSDEQVELYHSILSLKASPLLTRLGQEDTPIQYLHVLSVLHLLKQVCNHPALIKKDSQYKKYTSGKFELYKEILSEALGSGHKVVVFSQYISMLAILEAHCQEEQIPYVALTGQTQNRGQVVSDFQNKPEIKVFIASLLAGGVGIDLTAASVVIHYDRWWNHSKENQATDRVHRFGQKKFVQVFKLITRGTLEEKIHLMIEEKSLLFKNFMEKDEDVFKNLTRQELITLLT
ncbi:MAG: DEAD/DEAH box helicase [Oligoflexales bacterium]|nr:DEAD/DEAH box helicase [Oligoflexales bacterium]